MTSQWPTTPTTENDAAPSQRPSSPAPAFRPDIVLCDPDPVRASAGEVRAVRLRAGRLPRPPRIGPAGLPGRHPAADPAPLRPGRRPTRHGGHPRIPAHLRPQRRRPRLRRHGAAADRALLPAAGRRARQVLNEQSPTFLDDLAAVGRAPVPGSDGSAPGTGAARRAVRQLRHAAPAAPPCARSSAGPSRPATSATCPS